jgi:hypothetical protein
VKPCCSRMAMICLYFTQDRLIRNFVAFHRFGCGKAV